MTGIDNDWNVVKTKKPRHKNGPRFLGRDRGVTCDDQLVVKKAVAVDASREHDTKTPIDVKNGFDALAPSVE